MFLVATISAASYYLMWSGYGVYKKTGSQPYTLDTNTTTIKNQY